MAIALVPQALCSVTDVKLQMANDATSLDAKQDDLIALCINAFGTFAEAYCNRPFEVRSRTDYFDAGLMGGAGGPTHSIQLPAYPLDADTSLLSLYDDPSLTYASDTLLTENTDFVVDRAAGIISKAQTVFYQTGIALSGSVFPYFKGGPKSIKVISTGGLVTPRPTGPAAPTTVTSGTGLSGTYRHVITTVTDATGVESVASVASNPLAVSNQGIAVTFANPGTGKTTRVYRIKTGSATYYYSGSLAGSGAGGNQTYTDTIADSGLDTARTAPEAGPVAVASDLRFASVMMSGIWYRNRQNWSVQQMALNDAGSMRLVDPTALPKMVRETLDGYAA